MFFHLGTPAQMRRRREWRHRESLRLQERLTRLAERGWQSERRLADLRRAPQHDGPRVAAPPPITLLLFVVVVGVYFMDRLLARDALAWVVGGLDYADQLGTLAATVIPIVFISVEVWLGYHLGQVWGEYQEDKVPGLWVLVWAALALLVPIGVVAAVVYANWGDWGTPFVAAPFVLAGHVACVMSGTYLNQTLHWLADVVGRWRRNRVLPQAERQLREVRNRATATLQRLHAVRDEAEADGQRLPPIVLTTRARQWLDGVVGAAGTDVQRREPPVDETADIPAWGSKAHRIGAERL